MNPGHWLASCAGQSGKCHPQILVSIFRTAKPFASTKFLLSPTTVLRRPFIHTNPASEPTPRAHKNVEAEEWGLDIDKSAQSSPLAPNGLLVVLVVVVVVRVGWFDPVESNYFPGDTRFLFPTPYHPSSPLVTSLAHYVFHLRGGYASKSFRLVRHPPPPIITDETLGGQGMAWDEVKRNLSSSSWVG